MDDDIYDGSDGSGGDATNDVTTVSPLTVTAPLLTLGEQAALEQAPKLSDRPGWGLVKDIAGKVWNAPNTALGALYGGAGMAVGEVGHLLGLRDEAPSVQWRDNALQFTNNPFGGAGAITIGNTTTYYDDPYSPQGRQDWAQTEANEGHPVWEHEKQHTIQGQQLGPAYLPSNIAGGLIGWVFDRDKKGNPDWHGPHNWNERGPQANPPRPWE
jgi:hypothetical protein